MIVVHVSHEAVEKIGGIGTVIAGLTTAKAYAQDVTRTILLGPLLSTDRPSNLRLGSDGHVLYSSLDGIETAPWKTLFRPIERTYDVGIIYGTRKVDEPCSGQCVEVEVILVDVFHSNRDRLNLFKAELFKKFAVPSAQFENIWEYEEYVRLAEPGFEAVKALCGPDSDEQVVYLAHEYMGMPTALKAVLDGSPRTSTVFYAHEVASVRPLVEKLPGHDTMFYNVLEHASGNGDYLEDVFPEAANNYKHALVKAARYCDCVFAVGDRVLQELRFLDPHFRTMEIDLVYNGIPHMPLTLQERHDSHARMQQYAENLFGWRPNWIATHVARPVLSKAVWRDLRVLHEMEPLLEAKGESAVFFMLGTLAGQRRTQDVCHMERVYGWPVTHEAGYPDLCQGEEVLGWMFDDFNRHHRYVRAVFVNQWGWSRDVCGLRMPKDMKFADARRGTDIEFGLSVYEPFGISQFEPLTFGALCLPSNVCGCMGFAHQIEKQIRIDENIVEGDFLGGLADTCSMDELRGLPSWRRDEIENVEARRIAERVVPLLPRDEKTLKRRIKTGHDLAAMMSWEHVVSEYFLPNLDRAAARTQ